MTDSWWGDAEHDPTHEAAADWFARLQRDDISADDLVAWQRWLAADERNAEAFSRLEDLCAMLRDVPRPVVRVASSAERPAYNGAEAITDWQARRGSRRSFALAASLLLAGLLAATWGAWKLHDAAVSPSQVIETRVGENRTVQLADGSRVTLGGSTSLLASFAPTSRSIELTRGEALFQVAKDRSRPFRVQAGSATVTAVGTEFNVRRRETRVDVAVVEGEVVVESAPEPLADAGTARPEREIRVAAGEKTVVGNDGVQATSHFTESDAPIAWRSGRLVFENEPLREVVEDVNRYSRKRLAVEDESVGNLRFTGTVVNGNVDGWIASIEDVFSLEAVQEPDRVVLKHRDH
jgi:transmembrane sensor